MIKEGFTLNPYHELLPDYKLSPFSHVDIALNRNLPNDSSFDKYLDSRNPERDWVYTRNGKQAIYIALSSYDLDPNDFVTIITTSGNKYISKCVTDEIEKFCVWNHEIGPNTKVIFLIHEFGYPLEDMEKYTTSGIPVIEDCAYSFYSQNNTNTVGRIGEFAIYSFPKIFPVQFGGILSYSKGNLTTASHTDEDETRYLQKVISHWSGMEQSIRKKRLGNYNYLAEHFNQLGFPQRFETKDGVIPGVFMFKTGTEIVDLENMKQFFFAHGIQSSVFYGENCFFLPVHQNLEKDDLDYFIAVFKYYLEKYNR